MEKSKTTFENKQNTENLSSRNPIKAMTINSQPSNSMQTVELNMHNKQLSMQNTMKSNLLQIPQQYNMLSSLDGSEDEKSEFEGSYDGMMNKASLRSFYKLDSANTSEGVQSEAQFSPDKDLIFDTTTDVQEQNTEVAEVFIKIKSLGNLDKNTRNPFRRNSKVQEPTVIVSYEDKKYSKKHSSDLPSEMFEQSGTEQPKKSDIIKKASMVYIKQKSQAQLARKEKKESKTIESI